MTYSYPEALGASTLIRGIAVEVDTADALGTGATWIPVRGRSDTKPTQADGFQDDPDFESRGARSQTKTSEGWALEFKVMRKLDRATVEFDLGQEFLRERAQGKFGSDNLVHVRYFDTSAPYAEAWEGWTTVEWSPEGGAEDDLVTVSVTLTGNGPRTKITPNPAKPVVTTPGE